LNFRHRASLHDPRPTAKGQLPHSYYSQANRFPANATLQKSRSEAIGCLVQYCAGQNFNSRFALSEDHRPYGELLQTQTHIRHRYEYPSLPTLALGRAHLKNLVPMLIALETQSNHGGHLGRGHRRCLAPETNVHSRQSPLRFTTDSFTLTILNSCPALISSSTRKFSYTLLSSSQILLTSDHLMYILCVLALWLAVAEYKCLCIHVCLTDS